MTAKDKILKIMDLALGINPPDVENIGEKRTAVFVRWSPHCNVLNVTIHHGGWEKDKDPDEALYGYSVDSKYLDSVIARLEDIKMILKSKKNI